MTGMKEFIEVFGNISVASVVVILVAIGFLYVIYKKIRDYFINRYKEDEKRDKQLQTALDAIHKYPEYREQSLKIQKQLSGEIQSLRESQDHIFSRLQKMEDDSNRRERNKLRDKLLQSYRYYTNIEKNPSQSWTKMESEAFWELFKDYEDAGGDGYMHTTVQPAMLNLTVVDVPML